VGKVPDPKSQVEQITIALIYKFMDDMDAEAEELGGHRKFFANGYARYGWAKLMRSGLGGHETLNLYAEAIAKMPENPGIPPLFRDIFKNAYLPYRDPETLRAFLKIVDEFEYDHSERLLPGPGGFPWWCGACRVFLSRPARFPNQIPSTWCLRENEST
jgi:type I restriction enzyme M protein